MQGVAASPTSSMRRLWLTALLALLLAGIVLAPSAAAQSGDKPQLTVISQALNVRGGPGVTYATVGLLTQGDQVTIVGRHAASGWWQVKLTGGGTGWVSGRAAYVSVSGDTASLPEVTTPAPAAGAQPTSSPTSPPLAKTGGTVVFQTTSGGAMYAVNGDGSNLRYLTTGMDPALSPDSQWVAFTRWQDTQNGALGSLWVINVDGSGERAVLGDIHQPKSPTWSPDGARIIISMQHGGRVQTERKCGSEPPPPEAYDVDVDRKESGHLHFCYTLPPHPYWGLRVVDVASGAFEDLPNDLFSSSPAWDPANPWRLVYDGERGLMVLDLSQGATWSLTNDASDHSPVFSPDGSQIAVSYWQNDHWEIHVMNADTLTGTLARVAEPGRAGGTGRMRLTQTSIRAILEQQVKGQMPKAWNNAAPAWSPDGLQIAFLTDRTGQWEIWVMPAPGTQAQVNADGTNQHPLLPSEVQAQLHLQYNGMEERMLAWR